MAITPTDFDKIWSTNASTPAYTFTEADYLEGWDFVGNLPPTRAQWNAIQKRTDEKMKYVFDNFGAPLMASTVAEMTLQNRVYVYMGSEVGYTAGDWYYYDAGTSAWVDGGVYNAVAVVTDTTLTQAGVPADAKATGDWLNIISDEVLTDTEMQISTTATGWRLVPATGFCTGNANYKLVKYQVTAGKTYKVVSDDYFQFQTVASVPTSGTSNRIGDTYGAGTFYVTAPVGATYLIISTPTTGSTAKAYEVSMAIDPTLSISGEGADAKVTGDRLQNLQDSLQSFTMIRPVDLSTADVVNGIPYTNGKWYSNIDGRYESYSINAEHNRIKITASANNTYVAFVHYEGSVVVTPNANVDFAPGEKTPQLISANTAETFSVPVGTTHILIWKKNISTDTTPSKVEYLDKIDGNINTDQISNFEDIVKGKRFWGTLSHGFWDYATDTSPKLQYDYRVCCPYVLTFDEDVVINFYGSIDFFGFVGNKSYQGSLLQSVFVPKNTELRLGIRRLPANNTTPISIDEAYASIRFVTLTQWSEYMRLRDTFYNFDMFRSVGFVGDSFTAVRLGLSWVTLLQHRLGLTDVGNYGYGGQSTKSYIENGKLDVVLADTPKDFYWLALGINDTTELANNPSYLGSEADLVGSYEDYPATFWGSYGHIIEAIMAHSAQAKFVLFKPIATKQGWAYDDTVLDYISIRSAIDGIGEHYQIPVVDPLDDIFYQSADYSDHNDSYVGEQGGHPGVMAYPGICSANQRLFSKAVREHWTYFADLKYE